MLVGAHSLGGDPLVDGGGGRFHEAGEVLGHSSMAVDSLIARYAGSRKAGCAKMADPAGPGGRALSRLQSLFGDHDRIQDRSAGRRSSKTPRRRTTRWRMGPRKAGRKPSTGGVKPAAIPLKREGEGRGERASRALLHCTITGAPALALPWCSRSIGTFPRLMCYHVKSNR
jgi:hypothetical protein